MDDLVRRAMARWPNVPALYDWVRLDRRGEWWLRRSEAEPARFDRVARPQLVEFIARNYGQETQGGWYFQNGPQRAYVELEYTPWVLRLADHLHGLVTHTGMRVVQPERAFIDDAGALLVQFQHDIGVVLDRDLALIAERFADSAGRPIDAETLYHELSAGRAFDGMLLGERIVFEPIRAAEVPARFGFDPRPAAGRG